MSATIRIAVHGRSEPFDVEVIAPSHVRVTPRHGQDAIDVDVTGSGGTWKLSSATWAGTKRVVAVREGSRIWVLVGGRAFECEPVGDADTRSGTSAPTLDDSLRSPMPAAVVRVPVSVGSIVEKNAVLVVLEAMKMEVAIKAPHDGLVTAVGCAPGQLVTPADVLVTLGPRP